jgi:DNA-binding CsgD family transcriptional regulator
MDEKTRQLRDIFMDVAEDATVTERQEESRGSLASEERVEERLRAVVESMRDRYDFRSALPMDALVGVVRGFYEGDSDAEIADRLDDEPSPDTVARARVDLHLVTDRDLDAPFDLDDLRERLDADRSTSAIAEDLGASESTVRRYRHVVETERARKVVNDRYRDEFERLLADRDLEERLTGRARETGLEDATEGMESNVSF